MTIPYSDRCAGKVVVVTGAATTRGAVSALALARAGATVVAIDRFADGSGEIERSTLTSSDAECPGTVQVREVDVTTSDEWIALAYWLGEQFGSVDGLVNHTIIGSRDRLPDVDLDIWNSAFASNVTGPMLGMKYLAPLMPSGSSIVNVGSVVAVSGYPAAADTASKWALRGLTRTASLEYGRRGIRVNSVLPGVIDEPELAAASPAFVTAALGEVPLGRAGTSEEVAMPIVFLISDESSFVSGAELVVDGGQTGHVSQKSIADAVAARPKPYPDDDTTE